MRIAIVGSREYPKAELIKQFVFDLANKDTITIVSGGARGVDSIAEQAAKDVGIATDIYLADWDGKGKAAGYIRNKEIVANCDRIVAFWDHKSRGTAHTIKIGLDAGKPVTIFPPNFVGPTRLPPEREKSQPYNDAAVLQDRIEAEEAEVIGDIDVDPVPEYMASDDSMNELHLCLGCGNLFSLDNLEDGKCKGCMA